MSKQKCWNSINREVSILHDSQIPDTLLQDMFKDSDFKSDTENRLFY